MRTLLLFFALLVSALCNADTYKIIKLNRTPVVIGGKEKGVNSTFTDKETIVWRYDNQGMWVSDQTNGGYRYFSKEAFKSVGASTAYAYLKTNHPSTRSGFDLLPYTKAAYNSERRLALLIGNSNYAYEKSLRNPIADVTDISDQLRGLGFDVLRVFDADQKTIDEALSKFKATARGYATTLFYYAGHGQQYKGQTYLLPVDANVSTQYDITNRCTPGPRVVSFMNEIKANTNIVIIDACRSEQSLLRSSSQDELRMEAPDNGIVIFSTKSGEPASDGDGMHSPFADALLQNIAKTNLSLLDMVVQVTNEVKRKTMNYDSSQNPNYMSSLDHGFYFVYNGAAPAIQTQPVNTDPVPVIQPSASLPSEGMINGHEYVDLGLSVLWATCNLGAEKPEKYGSYFSWGDTEPTTKSGYKGKNKYYIDINHGFSKYISHVDGRHKKVDNKTTLEPSDDAAHQQWGGNWRMPTAKEWEELGAKCTITYTKQNGVKGIKVFGPNGNSIFLPCAGCGRYGDNIKYKGSHCEYWTSDLDKKDNFEALTYQFDIRYLKQVGPINGIRSGHRESIYPIRAVCPK